MFAAEGTKANFGNEGTSLLIGSAEHVAKRRSSSLSSSTSTISKSLASHLEFVETKDHDWDYSLLQFGCSCHQFMVFILIS